MKKITIKIIFSLFILVSIFSLFKNKVFAKDLDKINNYVITVDPNMEDGSLDIKVDISWQVLDSYTEGPLTWVKIGVPNYHVKDLKALTNNISKISYYHDEDGSFIRLDLDRSYYMGDVIDFSYSFNQSYMYHLARDYIYYDYQPGFFNSIYVENCTLRWKAANVNLINNMEFKIVDGYYTYSSRLRHGETIDINLRYEKSIFTTIDPNKTFSNESDPYKVLKIILMITIPLAIIILVTVLNRLKRDPYQTERGFYNRHIYWGGYHFYPSRFYSRGGVSKTGTAINPPKSVNGGGHGGGHGGCACACACACAGGGRAGCSMKDYYHTNLKSNKVIKALSEEEK